MKLLASRPLPAAFALVAVLVLTAHLACAATYYVDKTGDDSNAGTQAAPFRTITHAYSLASAGDQILVQPGTYTDYQSGWGLHLNKNGNADAPITLKSLQRGMAILDGSNESDRPFGVYVDGNYNVLDGFKITGAQYTAVFIGGGGSNNNVINNEITDNGRLVEPGKGHTGNQGIYENDASSVNYYAGNYIHDNGGGYGKFDHGLYLAGKSQTVVNNIVTGHPGIGLQIAGYTTVSGMKVFNNVFARNGGRGIVLWMALSNIQIINNIVAWNGTDGIGSYDAHGSGISISNNLLFRNKRKGINLTDGGSDFSHDLGRNFQKNPRFVSATDYHLKRSSPAIDAGISLRSVTRDISGNRRPSGRGYDIGAYEVRIRGHKSR